jgi:hypothetical protein
VKQRTLFHTKPVVITSKGLQGCRPAPEGKAWLRSFLTVEQCPPMEAPAIKARKRAG